MSHLTILVPFRADVRREEPKPNYASALWNAPITYMTYSIPLNIFTYPRVPFGSDVIVYRRKRPWDKHEIPIFAFNPTQFTYR